MNEPNASRSVPEVEERGLDLREWLRPVLAYKWLILTVALVVSAGVLFWTLKQPVPAARQPG
jgi:uncharacterized protein involved in exopolysaccharide biosynthesis